MKSLATSLWLMVGAVVMVSPAARAQDEPRYDTRTVATFSGVVSAVGSHTGKRGNPRTRVTLKTKDGAVELHLGPTVFLEEKKLILKAGDAITAIGSRVLQEDRSELIIVRQVTRGSQVLPLRNEEGRPLWEERHK